jgi:1-acyl-sn-glycerol-3-phosphate acyltransferase
LLRGLAIVLYLFPRWSEDRRHAGIRRWSRQLLTLFSMKLRCVDLPGELPPRCLLVLNHISWMDAFLVDAVHPAVFVAKAEVAGWPLVGTLAKAAGTVFIERGSRSATRRTNAHIVAALQSGRLVACFPEGITTHGHSVNRFHGALFQPAIDSGAAVLPVALRYLDAAGRRSEASAYVGEDSLIKSVWTLASHSALIAELRFLPALDANLRERRSLAQEARSAIANELAAAEVNGCAARGGRESEKASGPPGARH